MKLVKMMFYLGLYLMDRNLSDSYPLKPFVIGRKNWLFSASTQGAQSSAMLYSIIETAKVNGLVPYDYIAHCLEYLCANPGDIESVLPWNVKINV
jgi:hypothetical protein